MIDESVYSQLDSKWSRVTLGSSIYTIGGYGCTITSICRVAYNLTGQKFTPDKLAKTLKFTKEGLILWDSLSLIGLKARRLYGSPTSQILNDFGKRMILELNYHPKHWVAYEGMTGLGKLNVMDPLKGDFVSKKQTEVSGYCILEALNSTKPNENPDNVPNWDAVANGQSAKAIWEAAKENGYVSKSEKFDNPKTAGEIMIYLARLFPDKF